MNAGAARVRAQAPHATLRSVLTDYAGYSKIIKQFEQARVVGRSGDQTDVYLEVPILGEASKVWAIVRFAPPKTEGDQEIIRGRLVKGNVKRLDATWRIQKRSTTARAISHSSSSSSRTPRAEVAHHPRASKSRRQSRERRAEQPRGLLLFLRAILATPPKDRTRCVRRFVSGPPVAQTFDFAGAEDSELVPDVTNDAVILEEQPAVPGGVSVSYELSPRSVTTFVARVTVDEAAVASPACSPV
jgi:ribosome-associated toxin RatA of RatAB toxin-antitoxin module